MPSWEAELQSSRTVSTYRRLDGKINCMTISTSRRNENILIFSNIHNFVQKTMMLTVTFKSLRSNKRNQTVRLCLFIIASTKLIINYLALSD